MTDTYRFNGIPIRVVPTDTELIESLRVSRQEAVDKALGELMLLDRIQSGETAQEVLPEFDPVMVFHD